MSSRSETKQSARRIAGGTTAAVHTSVHRRAQATVGKVPSPPAPMPDVRRWQRVRASRGVSDRRSWADAPLRLQTP